MRKLYDVKLGEHMTPGHVGMGLQTYLSRVKTEWTSQFHSNYFGDTNQPLNSTCREKAASEAEGRLPGL